VDQLGCFVGGMFALAAARFPAAPPLAGLARTAAQLTAGCSHLYRRPEFTQVLGLGPEGLDMLERTERAGEAVVVQTPLVSEPSYQLRPEHAESLFVLFRTTGDGRYRDQAWELMQAIEAHCKVPGGGYAGLKSVRRGRGAWRAQDDVQPSFALAETFKYLLLIFAPPGGSVEDAQLNIEILPQPADAVGAPEYVFTTEAHPLLRTGLVCPPAAAARNGVHHLRKVS
jgi:mannosyl-oligosaccharide alpha-1,2-mannosidase